MRVLEKPIDYVFFLFRLCFLLIISGCITYFAFIRYVKINNFTFLVSLLIWVSVLLLSGKLIEKVEDYFLNYFHTTDVLSVEFIENADNLNQHFRAVVKKSNYYTIIGKFNKDKSIYKKRLLDIIKYQTSRKLLNRIISDKKPISVEYINEDNLKRFVISFLNVELTNKSQFSSTETTSPVRRRL